MKFYGGILYNLRRSIMNEVKSLSYFRMALDVALDTALIKLLYKDINLSVRRQKDLSIYLKQ